MPSALRIKDRMRLSYPKDIELFRNAILPLINSPFLIFRYTYEINMPSPLRIKWFFDRSIDSCLLELIRNNILPIVNGPFPICSFTREINM
jgi:hypothetical protein